MSATLNAKLTGEVERAAASGMASCGGSRRAGPGEEPPRGCEAVETGDCSVRLPAEAAY